MTLEIGTFSIPGRFTQSYMAKNHSHSGPKIKKIVPNVMKNLSTLTAFENTMKFWKP